MAMIDPANDTVVVRVVYDGPPMAGKTSSIRALAAGMGRKMIAPEEINGRTLYFDWLDYTAGLFEGRRIRCQIISVPGQATLASRRRRLLETADVVVFVGDSTLADQTVASNYLTGLRGVLAAVPGPPVGIVFQANKRDQPNAAPLDAIRTMLEETVGEVGLVESVAIDGTGIREAFIFSVRLALDRVRELMRTKQLHSARPDVDNAQDLLDELRRGEGSALDLAAESRLVHTRMSDIHQPAPAALAFQGVLRDNMDELEPGSVPAQRSSISAPAQPACETVSAAAKPTPSLPDSSLPSGMIWPPVHGRLILHQAIAAPVAIQRRRNRDWIGTAGSRWRFQSPICPTFASLEAGRKALVDWAHLHAASTHVLSEKRCILLSKDTDGTHRLWQIIGIEPSLHDELHIALRDGPMMIAKWLLRSIRAYLFAAERFANAACWLPLSLRSVGMRPSGPRFLGAMPDLANVRAPLQRSPQTTLKALAREFERVLLGVDEPRDGILSELERLICSEDAALVRSVRLFVRELRSSAAVYPIVQA